MTIEECKTLCGLIADGSPSQKFTDGTYKSWHMIIGNLPYVHTFKAWVALRRHVKYVDTPDLYAVVRRMRTQTRLAIRRVMRDEGETGWDVDRMADAAIESGAAWFDDADLLRDDTPEEVAYGRRAAAIDEPAIRQLAKS